MNVPQRLRSSLTLGLAPGSRRHACPTPERAIEGARVRETELVRDFLNRATLVAQSLPGEHRLSLVHDLAPGLALGEQPPAQRAHAQVERTRDALHVGVLANAPSHQQIANAQRIARTLVDA